MYKPQHQSDQAIPKDSLSEIDYQLMMDTNAYVKYNPSMVEYNHPEYRAFIQAHSIQLDPSMTEKHFHQDEYEYGSDSNNSSNGSLYFKDLDHQSSSLNPSFSHSDTAHFSSSYAAPVPSSMIFDTNYSSKTTKSNINEVIIIKNQVPKSTPLALLSPSSSQHSSNQQYIQCSANPYHVYQQNFGNTPGPSMYPPLEGYVSTAMPSFYDESHGGENNNNANAAWYSQQLEQFYDGTLDEQQQLFLMQQQKKPWPQHQQQQLIEYSHNQHDHISPSSYDSSAYTTENDDSRSQIYVRKACVSCKQSHVACDVQRPCSRCVRLNKTETCVDAQRKKRGRPCGSGKKKKEEEHEFRRQYQQYF